MPTADKSSVLRRAISEFITSDPEVCGGKPCIARTRIPVWMVAYAREDGLDTEEILELYPSLTKDEVAAAFAYADEHPQEIRDAIRANHGR